MVSAIPYESLSCYILYKAQEWHACTCSTPEVIAIAIDCLASEPSKLRFGAWVQFIWWIFENRLISKIDEVGGVVGVTPEGMGHHIL